MCYLLRSCVQHCTGFTFLVWDNVVNGLLLQSWAFLKLWNAGAGRGIIGREGKPIPRADVDSSENESLFPQGWKGSVVVNLTLGAPGWSPWRAQCPSLLVEDWAVSSGRSYICLGEREAFCLDVCIVSIPATMATPFMSLFCKFWEAKDRGWKTLTD